LAQPTVETARLAQPTWAINDERQISGGAATSPRRQRSLVVGSGGGWHLQDRRRGGGEGQNHLAEKLLEGGSHRIGRGRGRSGSNSGGVGALWRWART
jgi:hypothetical protein